jgi:hypothetical protein
MRLPILPDEISIDLSKKWRPGVCAIARPPDVVEAGEFLEAMRGAELSSTVRALSLVRQQLLRVEGPDGKIITVGELDEPFDPKNEIHLRRAMPVDALFEIYNELHDFIFLPEVTEKNSDSPSGSGGTRSTGGTRAARARRGRGKNSAAD